MRVDGGKGREDMRDLTDAVMRFSVRGAVRSPANGTSV